MDAMIALTQQGKKRHASGTNKSLSSDKDPLIVRPVADLGRALPLGRFFR